MLKLNYNTWYKFSMSEMYTARWIDVMERARQPDALKCWWTLIWQLMSALIAIRRLWKIDPFEKSALTSPLSSGQPISASVTTCVTKGQRCHQFSLYLTLYYRDGELARETRSKKRVRKNDAIDLQLTLAAIRCVHLTLSPQSRVPRRVLILTATACNRAAVIQVTNETRANGQHLTASSVFLCLLMRWGDERSCPIEVNIIIIYSN